MEKSQERQKFNASSLSTAKAAELVQIGYEGTELDYKTTIDFRSSEQILEIAKDVIGFANTLEGYIVIGVNDNCEPIGVGEHYHYDSADLQQKLERYCSPRPLLEYGEFAVSLKGANDGMLREARLPCPVCKLPAVDSFPPLPMTGKKSPMK